MAVAERVMWAELQQELSGAGLNVSVGIPVGEGPWNGTIDDLLFTMTIPPRNEENGYRDFLFVSLFGQDEKKVIDGLTKFMGYSPFCKYQDKRIDEAASTKDLKVTGTYEWNKDNSKRRLKEITKNENLYGIEEIKEGFQPVDTKPDMAGIYNEFTPKVIKKWEAAVKKNPDAEYNYQKIADFLPFIKAVKPRIGANQSLLGLSIISLDRKYTDEGSVVSYGLEPLFNAGIIREDERLQILEWFRNTQPTWDSNNYERFEKRFEVGGQKYWLYTDCCRGCRDLNLQAVHKVD